MKLGVYLNTLRLEGYLAYEYNPFHNYLTNVDLYLVDNIYLVPKNKAVNIRNGLILTNKVIDGEECWADKNNNIISNKKDYKTWNDEGAELYAKAGSLVDFDTDLLNFDINHPVDIEIQPSYDGSVNLILNDDKNIPRLINSRFSAREKNKYEIVDRIGENDTNIYSSDNFDKDTSLYFLYQENPTIKYLGFVKGILPVGLYCFYFTYCDSDDNESDFIAESGVIPAFIGNDGDPNSMDGGIKNLNSNKGIYLKLVNLDKSYNYIKIYYVRYFADYNQNRVYECKKIYKKYPILLVSSSLYLQITGYEDTEEIDANILNISRFNPKSVLTQALCKNMLFFGNIVKNSDNYKELSDCALRIFPLVFLDEFNTPTIDGYYGNPGYYDSKNMYEKVGYFPGEYYRFGVVFIYKNGSLSNVYNTMGGHISEGGSIKLKNSKELELFTKSESNPNVLFRNYIKVNELNFIDDDNIEGEYLNSKGVCKIEVPEDFNKIIGIQFNIPENVKTHLKELGIRGLFFVRQKCIPNIIALCYITKFDTVLKAPVLLLSSGKNIVESFVNKDGMLTNDYKTRLREYSGEDYSIDPFDGHSYAGICPDFLLNQPYYNQIFNGGKFRIKLVSKYKLLNYEDRMYYAELKEASELSTYTVRICTVTEDVPTIALKDLEFRLHIGETEEAYRIGYFGVDPTDKPDDLKLEEEAYKETNIVRGTYSPYLAIYSDSTIYGSLESGIYNILPEFGTNITQEYLNRMNSKEPFYAISERLNFDEVFPDIYWRGDCFLNLFTYRLNRNFNDPSLPNNDKIIVRNTWKDNYMEVDSNNPTEKFDKISRSDVNAVLLGSWITLKVRSSINYALRSEDHSYVSEEALMGTPRSFYPKSRLLHRGSNKLPDSYLYNDAYRASLGFKCYFALEDVNYIKNTFSNRIQYSAIAILDSFKNNYRDSLSTYFRDYSLEYGGITKLLEYSGCLLVIFEHGIGIAAINERVLAGQGEGGPVFINTLNVLPEELNIISDTYGSLWTESIVKTESGNVYGVDTIAKKIWRVKGLYLEIISDFKVNKFLIDNITLGERELFPIVGLKNVKTHYNNNKKDVMFTFYDDIYLDEEKVWNLCYNELLELFITFYSWIPSYSENIDTKFFTFDRNTSKNLSLLYQSNYNIPENTGVVIDSPILDSNNTSLLYYRNPDDIQLNTVLNEDGTSYIKIEDSFNSLLNKLIPNEDIKFKVEKDHWGNWKLLDNINSNNILSGNKLVFKTELLKVILLYITPFISRMSSVISDTLSMQLFKTELVAVTSRNYINNNLITSKDKEIPGLTTDFYLHGLAGSFNVTEDIYPCYWYGKYHPFEIEFVVNDKIGLLKIFENLVIISNSAEPESFHFEIEGDNYEFSSDKRNMYFRLEATKELFLNLGSDIVYNRKYTDVTADKLTNERYYRNKSDDYIKLYVKLDKVYPVQKYNLSQQVKSTIFPLYYERIDTYDDVYHTYRQMEGDGYDFKNLSGSELLWDRRVNNFNIVTHIKNSPINLHGRLRGNSMYKEGKWEIQIPSIIFNLKNEPAWNKVDISDNYFILDESLLDSGILGKKESSTTENKISLPPIVINTGQKLPSDIKKSKISKDDLPNIFRKDPDIEKYISVGNWSPRKEARIRDKYIKIRIRYSGKNLAIIHSIITLYNISYS